MLAGSRARDLRVVQADLGALPFPDGAFDLVCSFKVLAHVSHLDLALRELKRVVRPGGTLILEFYNPWSLRWVGKRLKRPTPVGEGATDADVYTRYDPPHRLAGLMPPGVRVVEVRGIRVLTPVSHLHRVPLLGRVLAAAERACTRSPLRYFAGFLVAVARREG